MAPSRYSTFSGGGAPPGTPPQAAHRRKRPRSTSALLLLSIAVACASFAAFGGPASTGSPARAVNASPDADASNAPKATAVVPEPDNTKPDADGEMAYFGSDPEMKEFLDAIDGPGEPDIQDPNEIMEDLQDDDVAGLPLPGGAAGSASLAPKVLRLDWTVSGELTLNMDIDADMLAAIKRELSEQAVELGCDVAKVSVKLVMPSVGLFAGASVHRLGEAAPRGRRLTAAIRVAAAVQRALQEEAAEEAAAEEAEAVPTTGRSSKVAFTITVHNQAQALELGTFVSGPTFGQSMVAELKKDPAFAEAGEGMGLQADKVVKQEAAYYGTSFPARAKKLFDLVVERTPWNLVSMVLWQVWGGVHVLAGLYGCYFSFQNQPDEAVSALAWKANPKQFQINWAPAAHRAVLQHSFNQIFIGAWACTFAALHVVHSNPSGYFLMLAPLGFQLGTWLAWDVPNYGAWWMKLCLYVCNAAMLAQVYDLHDQAGWDADLWFFASLPSWIVLGVAFLYLAIQPRPEKSTEAFAIRWALTHPDLASEAEAASATANMAFGAPKGAHVHLV